MVLINYSIDRSLEQVLVRLYMQVPESVSLIKETLAAGSEEVISWRFFCSSRCFVPMLLGLFF